LPIDEGLVLDKMKPVGSRHQPDGGVQIVSIEWGLWHGHRRLHGTGISNPVRAPIQLNLLLVNLDDLIECQEDWLERPVLANHSASRLNARP